MNASNSIQLKVNEKNLVKHLHLTFSNSTTFLAEMMQNARRAGATHVSFEYDVETQSITITDDGYGIEDLSVILHIAESGWDEETVAEESPYGIGFLSALFSAERVSIDSMGNRISFWTETALQFGLVPIEQSHITSGTVIRLEGIKLDPEAGLTKYAEGFPIPVFYNGVELERPHAINGGLSFIDTAVGSIAMVDSDATAEKGSTLGSEKIRAYLQGLPVYENRGPGQPNIVHLDSKQFKGRLPDRDKLINESDSVQKVLDIIQGYWKERLTQEKQQLSARDFVVSYANSCIYWGVASLMNDVPFLPANSLQDHGNVYPCCYQDWEGGNQLIKDILTQEDIVSGKVKVVSFDEPFESDPFQVAMYVYLMGACTINARLDEGHWLHQHVVDIELDDIELEVTQSKDAAYSGNWVYDNVLLCDTATLKGPLGSVETTDQAFLFDSGLIRKDGRLSGEYVEGHGSGVIVAPRNCSDGIVVRQRNSFIGEFDQFFESDKDKEIELFERFMRSHRAGTEAELVKELLSENNIRSYESLKGKSFIVVISDDGDVGVEQTH